MNEVRTAHYGGATASGSGGGGDDDDEIASLAASCRNGRQAASARSLPPPKGPLARFSSPILASIDAHCLLMRTYWLNRKLSRVAWTARGPPLL